MAFRGEEKRCDLCLLLPPQRLLQPAALHRPPTSGVLLAHLLALAVLLLLPLSSGSGDVVLTIQVVAQQQPRLTGSC